jgi:hypothetical protein
MKLAPFKGTVPIFLIVAQLIWKALLISNYTQFLLYLQFLKPTSFLSFPNLSVFVNFLIKIFHFLFLKTLFLIQLMIFQFLDKLFKT